MRENPVRMDDLALYPFQETSNCSYSYGTYNMVIHGILHSVNKGQSVLSIGA